MDLWKHKHEVNKKKIKKQCGFTLVIMPHYQGKTVRIVLTPLRIYTAVLSIALLVVFAGVLLGFHTGNLSRTQSRQMWLLLLL